MISMTEPKRKNTDAAQRINRQDNQSNQIRSSQNQIESINKSSHTGTHGNEPNTAHRNEEHTHHTKVHSTHIYIEHSEIDNIEEIDKHHKDRHSE